jgi:hypothetical protein
MALIPLRREKDVISTKPREELVRDLDAGRRRRSYTPFEHESDEYLIC